MARALDSALEMWKRRGMPSRHSSPGSAPALSLRSLPVQPPFDINFTVPERRPAQFLRPIQSGCPKVFLVNGNGIFSEKLFLK